MVVVTTVFSSLLLSLVEQRERQVFRCTTLLIGCHCWCCHRHHQFQFSFSDLFHEGLHDGTASNAQNHELVRSRLVVMLKLKYYCHIRYGNLE